MGSSDWRPDVAERAASSAPDLTPDGVLRRQQPVPHAPVPPPRSEPPLGHAGASCARCRAPLPRTKSGKVKAGIRFCREACRLADVRARRAAARTELAKAFYEIRIQLDHAEDALAILGLLPVEQRHGGSRGR